MPDSIQIKCYCENPDQLPVYSTAGSAGADLFAYLPEDAKILPGERCLIPTGMKMEIPAGYEAQIRPRSGLAIKYGITLLNTPGTIDSDYRGEIKIIIINHGHETFIIKSGDRIAQIVIAPVSKGNFCLSKVLAETERGEDGFGSTGL